MLFHRFEALKRPFFFMLQGEDKKSAWKNIPSPARRASLGGDKLTDHKLTDLKKPSMIDTAPPPGLKKWQWEDKEDDNQDFQEVLSAINSGQILDNDEVSLLRNGALNQSISTLTKEEEILVPKSRNRSKSSSAIYSVPEDEVATFPDISSIWGSPKPENPMHRRASTQPTHETFMWEALRSAQLATENDPNGVNTEQLMEKFKQQQGDFGQRRFSVAPSRFMTDFDKFDSSPDGMRRHSTAGPYHDAKFDSQYLNQGFDHMALTDPKEQLESINQYFSNSDARTKSWLETSKNLQQNADNLSPTLSAANASPQAAHQWPLYVVEFKAGRTDYFYLSDDSVAVKVGDLAIVEADRGKDLGKVIDCGISNTEELELYRSEHVDSLVDSHNAVGKEIIPKRIFRVAQPSEISMLMNKGQDEEKAMALCQTKIRQKKLPMEVVDAEYQWDRRKLTFYFVSDRRIDFRELVRELFKIYKTRIWMYFQFI
jgi:hypothetical protein